MNSALKALQQNYAVGYMSAVFRFIFNYLNLINKRIFLLNAKDKFFNSSRRGVLVQYSIWQILKHYCSI